MTMKRVKSALTAVAITFMAAGAITAQAPSSPYNDGVARPSPSTSGQMNDGVLRAPNTPPANGAPVDPAKSFDAAFTRVENLWMGAAQAMPAEKYNFAPSSAIFIAGQKVQYDGVRTFAQIVTHTIQANYGGFAAISGLKPDVDVKAIGDLKSKDDIVKALAATFEFAHKAIATITPANAFASIRGVQTPASMVAGLVGHAEDEYGQAVEYLRMNAIVPPASEPRKM